jgi:hypothetical protein
MITRSKSSRSRLGPSDINSTSEGKLRFSKHYMWTHPRHAPSLQGSHRLPEVSLWPRVVPESLGGPSGGGGVQRPSLRQVGDEEEDPDTRPLQERFGALDPKHSLGSGCVCTPGGRLCLPVSGPVPSPGSSTPRHHRFSSERPSAGTQQFQRTEEADTHLTAPQRELGPPGHTTATTGKEGSQRASPRPTPSRKILQVPLNAGSPLPRSLPSFCNPPGAPRLAGMRAPGTSTRAALTQPGPWSELAPDIAFAVLT